MKTRAGLAGLFFGVCVVVAGSLRCGAAPAGDPGEEETRAPTPPLVKGLPSRVKWVMKFAGGAGEGVVKPDAPEAYNLASMTVDQDGAVRHVELRYRGGVSREAWVAGDWYVVTTDRRPALQNAPGVRGHDSKIVGDLQGMDVVDLANFQKVDTTFKKRADFYSETFHGAAGLSPALLKVLPAEQRTSIESAEYKKEAWVDAETKYPVAIRIPEGLYLYEFQFPETRLAIPEVMRRLLAERKKEDDFYRARFGR